MAKVSASLVVASASIALSCFGLSLLVAPVLRAKNRRPSLSGKRRLSSIGGGGERRDCGNETERTKGIEIHCSATPRNKKILRDAVELSSVEPWGYSNCHFASILAQLRPSPFIMQWGSASRKLEKILSSSGCHIEVEFFNPLLQIVSCETPMVILLHGIGGHSREAYIEQAALQIVNKGWKVAVLNYSKVSVVGDSSLGGNCLTDCPDINFLVSHIRNRHSGFLAAIGYSMGGSKLVQFLLRVKEHCNLDAACTISSPLDFTKNNDTVHHPHGTFISSLYHWVVSSHLKLWILKHYSELKKHNRVGTGQPFRRTRSGLLFWFKANSVPDIDRAITMPMKGRKDLHTYYKHASTLGKLGEGMMIPFLCITALNDPFIPKSVIPPKDVADANENIFIANTVRGGHIGYWLPQVGCWATGAAISFFDSVRINEPSAHAHKSKYRRQASSIDAAHSLQSTSHTGLTNYFDFVDFASCSDLVEEEGKMMLLGHTWDA